MKLYRVNKKGLAVTAGILMIAIVVLSYLVLRMHLTMDKSLRGNHRLQRGQADPHVHVLAVQDQARGREVPVVGAPPDTASPPGLQQPAPAGNLTVTGEGIKIPHRIHQIWDSYMIPEMWSGWIKSWVQNHPDWEYWFWPETVANKLLQTRPDVAKVYFDLKDKTFRSNVLRFLFIYNFGGVYIDLDVESLKPFTPLTEQHYCLISAENLEHPYLAYNAPRAKAMMTILACRPHHPFFVKLLDELPLYPAMDFNHKHRLADTVYLRWANDTRERPEADRLHFAEGRFFYATFDPVLTRRIKQKCGAGKKLNAAQQELCDYHRESSFSNKPRPEAYTNHYWVHVGENEKRIRTASTVDVRDLIPKHQWVDVEAEVAKLISDTPRR